VSAVLRKLQLANRNQLTNWAAAAAEWQVGVLGAHERY